MRQFIHCLIFTFICQGCASTPKPLGLKVPLYGPGSASDPEFMKKESFARHSVHVFNGKYSKISGAYYSDKLVLRYYGSAEALSSRDWVIDSRRKGLAASLTIVGGLVLGAAGGAWAGFSYMDQTNAAREAGLGGIGVFIVYLAAGELLGAGLGASLGKLASLPLTNSKRDLREKAAAEFNLRLSKELGLAFEMQKKF